MQVIQLLSWEDKTITEKITKIKSDENRRAVNVNYCHCIVMTISMTIIIELFQFVPPNCPTGGVYL